MKEKEVDKRFSSLVFCLVMICCLIIVPFLVAGSKRYTKPKAIDQITVNNHLYTHSHECPCENNEKGNSLGTLRAETQQN